MSSKKGEMIAAQSNLFAPKQKVPVDDPNALTIRDDGAITLGDNIRITRMGIMFSDQLTSDEYDKMFDYVLAFEDARPWILGDIIAKGTQVGYGDVTKIAQLFRRDPQTAMNCAAVCRSIEISRRREGLDFGHHDAVSALPPDKQDHYLRLAEEGEDGKRWSVRRLREEISKVRTTDLEKKRRKAIQDVRRWLKVRLEMVDKLDDRTLGMVLVELGRELMDE